MGRIILPENMDVVVASFGGVGTTFLIKFISGYLRTNHFDDEDGLKHPPVPPVSRNRQAKFIYVYGNPQLAVVSLFRRDYHHLQSLKLRRCVTSPEPPIPQDMTLEEYVAAGVDRLYLREHFNSWYHTSLSPCPTMFIRYETLFDNVQPLLDFLGLEAGAAACFPARKKRASALEGISAATGRGLDEMYGGFEKELSRLDDVVIRKKSADNMPGGYPMGSLYLKAYGRQAFFEVKEFFRHHSPRLYEQLRKGKRRFF